MADPASTVFFSVKRNGHIQRNPVHPRAQLETRIILRVRKPKLQYNLLNEVFAVFFVTAVGVGDLVDDAFVGINDLQKRGRILTKHGVSWVDGPDLSFASMNMVNFP